MRYYYTDALIAAYMGREFGVKYDSCPMNLNFDRAGSPVIFYPDRYYIHPESLYILEPQVGDLLYGTGCEEIVEDDAYWDESTPCYTTLKLALKWWTAETKIIQRGGKAFFMPEVEV